MGTKRVYLSLGSNLGERARFLTRGVELIRRIPDTWLIKTSSLYETEPVGVLNQPMFLNCAVEIETRLSPEDLLRWTQRIEKRLGRRQKGRSLPRPIDIDILFFDQEVIKKTGLEIPHPRLHHRLFALIPLAEITKDFLHPTIKKTIEELLKENTFKHKVTRYNE